MTYCALHTNEILQCLVLDMIVIAYTIKNDVFISTWISLINMRICNELLNFFVSVYVFVTQSYDISVWLVVDPQSL